MAFLSVLLCERFNNERQLKKRRVAPKRRQPNTANRASAILGLNSHLSLAHPAYYWATLIHRAPNQNISCPSLALLFTLFLYFPPSFSLFFPYIITLFFPFLSHPHPHSTKGDSKASQESSTNTGYTDDAHLADFKTRHHPLSNLLILDRNNESQQQPPQSNPHKDTTMRNGHSSAVDQTGVPVYRGTQAQAAARESALDDNNSTAPVASRRSLDESRELHNHGHGKVVYSNDSEDSSRFTKFKSRRSLPWYQSRELQIVGAITLLSFIVRLWAIDYPTSVV